MPNTTSKQHQQQPTHSAISTRHASHQHTTPSAAQRTAPSAAGTLHHLPSATAPSAAGTLHQQPSATAPSAASTLHHLPPKRNTSNSQRTVCHLHSAPGIGNCPRFTLAAPFHANFKVIYGQFFPLLILFIPFIAKRIHLIREPGQILIRPALILPDNRQQPLPCRHQTCKDIGSHTPFLLN